MEVTRITLGPWGNKLAYFDIMVIDGFEIKSGWVATSPKGEQVIEWPRIKTTNPVHPYNHVVWADQDVVEEIQTQLVERHPDVFDFSLKEPPWMENP